MKIDIKPILALNGESVRTSYSLSLSDMDFWNEKPFKAPIEIEASVTNRLGMLELKMSASTTYFTFCSRCLKEIQVPFTTEINQILTKDETDEENEEIIHIDGDLVELDEIIVPAIILDVDRSYVCSQQCNGLCAKCGKDLNMGDCSCDKIEIDDRLSVLKKLLEK